MVSHVTRKKGKHGDDSLIGPLSHLPFSVVLELKAFLLKEKNILGSGGKEQSSKQDEEMG